MTKPEITARTLASAAAFESIAAEWRDLENATPEATGFQSPAWRLCGEWGAATPRLVAVREKGRLVMLLPLQIDRAWGASAACWLGAPLAQYGDALALPGARRPDWYRAAEAEMTGWSDVDLFALTRLRDDSVLAACGAPLALAQSDDHVAPFADLGEAVKSRHKSVERRMKKLVQFGKLRFEAVSGPRERREAAEQALTFKHEWLRRQRRFSASLSSPEVCACVLGLAETGLLTAHRLWAGERLVSVELGLRRGGVYRSFMGAYDEDLADASPGNAMTLHLFPALAAQGIRRYDFLPPADPYKMIFATGSAPTGAFYRPLNARGALAAFAMARLRPLAKDAFHALARAGLPLESLLSRRARAAKPVRSESRHVLAALGANSSK